MVHWEHYKWKYLAAILLFAVTFSWADAQEGESITGDPSKGEQLFKANCAACHTLDKKLVGPALGGVVERLQNDQGLGKEWLHSWIKDNEALRASGDEYANKVFEENNQTVMTAFPQLSDEDIDNILAYTTNPPVVEEPKDSAPAAEPANTLPVGALIIGFAVIAALLIWLLFRVNTLIKLSEGEGEELTEGDIKTFSELFERNKKFAYFALGVLGVVMFYGLWMFMTGIDVNKGYKPEQPIYFSHKIHAGEQEIDCQYCHSSAKYGKVSGIPSTNVCMNCHYQIQEYKGDYVEEGKSKEFYTEQIQKIYQAIGFDKNNLTYTGEYDPVEWTRIHNLPDFVYFSHAQHVVAGEQAIKNAKNVEQVCYACHGRVDQMNEVEMANDFTMGWCIECHRATEVDMDNGYNKEYYAQLHEKLKQEYGEGTTITVDAIGGLECGKCHY